MLLLLDAALVQADRQFVRLNPAMTDMCEVEVELNDRCLALGRPVRTRVGRSLRPDSSMKTISRPSRLGFF